MMERFVPEIWKEWRFELDPRPISAISVRGGDVLETGVIICCTLLTVKLYLPAATTYSIETRWYCGRQGCRE